MPITVGGDAIYEITADGRCVQEVTVDGKIVWIRPLKIIDDFEDGDISEYTYSGDWKIEDLNVQNRPHRYRSGTRGLQSNNTDSSEFITSTSGLNHYPQPGETWRVFMQAVPAGPLPTYFISHYFAVQSETSDPSSVSGYRVALTSDPELKIERVDSGSITTLNSTTNVNFVGDFMDFEIQWGQGGDIRVDVWRDGSTFTPSGGLTANDTNYTSGGIGFLGHAGNGDSDEYYDYLRVVKTIIDDFEYSDTELFDRYIGSSNYETSGISVQNGQFHLHAKGVQDNELVVSTPGDQSTDLRYYPSQCDKWRFWMYPSTPFLGNSQADATWLGFYFGVQNAVADTQSITGYRFVHRKAGGPYSNDVIALERVDSGNRTVVGSQQAPFNVGNWYEYEIAWHPDGEMEIKLFDDGGTQLASLSVNDSNFSSGGIGWQANRTDSDSVDAYFDYARTVR